MKRLIPFAALTALPLLATAHPGHGTSDGWSLVHFLTSYEHSLTVVAALVLIFVLAGRRQWRKSRTNA